MAQKQRVLEFVERNGSISSLEAIYGLGVTRLSDVIYKLKKDGYKFDTVIERGTNRFGEKTEYARYYIVE